MEAKSRRPGNEGDGFDVPLARGPSKPTENALPTQSRTDPVDIFFAGEPDDKRAIRRSIHWCNAASAVRAARSLDDDARNLFWLTAQLAGCWTFRPASQESLTDARQALRHLYVAADRLERLETPYDGD